MLENSALCFLKSFRRSRSKWLFPYIGSAKAGGCRRVGAKSALYADFSFASAGILTSGSSKLSQVSDQGNLFQVYPAAPPRATAFAIGGMLLHNPSSNPSPISFLNESNCCFISFLRSRSCSPAFLMGLVGNNLVLSNSCFVSLLLSNQVNGLYHASLSDLSESTSTDTLLSRIFKKPILTVSLPNLLIASSADSEVSFHFEPSLSIFRISSITIWNSVALANSHPRPGSLLNQFGI